MSAPACNRRGMYEDFDRCYRAVQSKDSRFDGWFVTAVLTTGIYCRPSCPVRPPFARNVRFYPTAAAAQREGFRACKRCRPDASPGSPEWNVRGDVVARAMRLIADGTVDRDGVTGLAARVGYTTRQLERLLQAEVGANPLALARAQRTQTARVLIETTDLPFGDVAFAAGFSSIRQFNDTLMAVSRTDPDGPARNGRERASVRGDATGSGVLTLRLPVRTPFAYEGVFGHLAASAVPGVEEVRDGAFRRTLRLASGNGVVSLTPQPDHVLCELMLDDFRDLSTAIARCRRLLDLDADPEAVVDALSADAHLSRAGRQGSGPTDPPHRRRVRVGAPGGHRTTDLGEGGADARRTSRAAYGSPIDDPNVLSHTFPERRAARGDRSGAPRVPEVPPADLHRSDSGASRRGRRPRPRLRLEPRPTTTAGAARYRTVDRGGHRDAGARRPGRLSRSPISVCSPRPRHSVCRRIPAHSRNTAPAGDRGGRMPLNTFGRRWITTSTSGRPRRPRRRSDGHRVLPHRRQPRRPAHAGRRERSTAASADGRSDLRTEPRRLGSRRRGVRRRRRATGGVFRRRTDGLRPRSRLGRHGIPTSASGRHCVTIPYGETRSYGAIAAQIGSPGASRAVGLANGHNPIGSSCRATGSLAQMAASPDMAADWIERSIFSKWRRIARLPSRRYSTD